MEDLIMAIITQYHKDTDTTYVYESISYWDPEKQQSRSKRKCIGKIDPVTGEIVPTGKRGRRKSAAPSPADDARVSKLDEQLDKAKAEIAALKSRNAELSDKVRQLTHENQQLTGTVKKILSLSESVLA